MNAALCVMCYGYIGLPDHVSINNILNIIPKAKELTEKTRFTFFATNQSQQQCPVMHINDLHLITKFVSFAFHVLFFYYHFIHTDVCYPNGKRMN